MTRRPVSSPRPLGFAVMAALAVSLLAFSASPAHAVGRCPDTNGDGVVDGTDLGYLLGVWGTSDPAADFNGDGVVGCFDQEYLLGNWGNCETCPADLNNDGTVNGSDLGILLGNWGIDCRFDLDGNGVVGSNDDDALFCLWGPVNPNSHPNGDFNRDGVVDGADLGLLLGAWGRSCVADINGDGAVDGTDRALLLAAWGRCP